MSQHTARKDKGKIERVTSPGRLSSGRFLELLFFFFLKLAEHKSQEISVSQLFQLYQRELGLRTQNSMFTDAGLRKTTGHQAWLTAQGYIRGSPTGRVAYIRLLSIQGGVGKERLMRDKDVGAHEELPPVCKLIGASSTASIQCWREDTGARTQGGLRV